MFNVSISLFWNTKSSIIKFIVKSYLEVRTVPNKNESLKTHLHTVQLMALLASIIQCICQHIMWILQ